MWDDDAHISHNPTLADAGGLHDIWLVPGATMQYYPLTFTAWWAGYRLWGLNPLGYHLATLLMHVGVSLLLWLVLETIAPSPPGTPLPWSWLAAMIFALHPVNVMSVAWATELKNTLSGWLALLSCWAYLRFAGFGSPGTAKSRRRFYGLALVLFLLALLAKTAVSMLPATLLLILWWRKPRLEKSDWLALTPMILLAAGTGLITIYVEHHSGGAFGREFTIPYVDRLLVSGRSFWFYLGKVVLPYPFAFIYERWEIDRTSFVQWLYPAATAGLLGGLFLLRKRIGKGPFAAAAHYYLATSGLIFLVVTYMTRYSFVSDHWQYYGLMSAAALFGAALAPLAARGASYRTMVAAILVVLAVATWRRTLPYRNVETLFLATIENNPRAWMCLSNLGSLRASHQRFSEAIALYDRALAVNPDNEETYNNRGSTYLQMGEPERAIADTTRALTLWPKMTEAAATRAMAYASLGRFDRAVADYSRAIELRPTFAEAFASRGAAYYKLGKLDLAIADCTAALSLNPRLADVYGNRGVFQLAAGKGDLAIADQTKAIELDRSPSRYRNRALAYRRAGRWDDAIRDLDAAIAMDGRYLEAYRDRALCFARLGRLERAAADVRAMKALGGEPDAELDDALKRSG